MLLNQIDNVLFPGNKESRRQSFAIFHLSGCKPVTNVPSVLSSLCYPFRLLNQITQINDVLFPGDKELRRQSVPKIHGLWLSWFPSIYIDVLPAIFQLCYFCPSSVVVAPLSTLIPQSRPYPRCPIFLPAIRNHSQDHQHN